MRFRKVLIGLKGFLLLAIIASMAQGAVAQFTEDFGNIGSLRQFQGQIRDGLDAPVPWAEITITNVSTGDSYEVTANEKGVFRSSLRRGDYEVRVRGTGFNHAIYKLKIDPKGSKLYVVTRLSPGCGSGNSGVALIKRLKNRSFTDEN